MASVASRHTRRDSVSRSSTSSASRANTQNTLKTPTASASSASSKVGSSGQSYDLGSRQRSTRSMSQAANLQTGPERGTHAQSTSITKRRMAFDYDDDSDDDDDGLNVPQLSDLAKKLLGSAGGLGDGGNAGTGNGDGAAKPSSGGLKRKQSDGSSVSTGGSVTRADGYHRTTNSRPVSPSRKDLVTPAIGSRQSRRTTAPPSSAHNSGGSSSGGGSGNSKGTGRDVAPHETPAYGGSISRPTGSVARQWQTTTRRPTRGLTLGMPIRGPKRDAQAEPVSSPDEMLGQENALGRAAPSYDLEDIGGSNGKDSQSGNASAGKSSTHSRSASRYHRLGSPSPQDEQCSGSPPQKVAKYSASPVEREREIRRSVSPPQLRKSSSSLSKRSPVQMAPASPEIKVEQPIEDRAYVSPVRMLHKRVSSSAVGKTQPKSTYAPPAPVVSAQTEQDKENAVPVISYRKPAPAPQVSVKAGGNNSPPLKSAPVATSAPEQTTPHGPALASRSSNTPHRMAPPPPRMPSAIEMQTTRAGAAAASTTKRQNVVVNGIKYLRLEQIGRGGSGKVYRVMADSFKMMAMKKVVFEQQDENIIRGFKGEIDLLRKLKDVDRVVKLYDFEVNEAKGTLTVLLEFGELDLNKMINTRNNGDDSKLDLSFLRFIWKEMLECVDAVHQYNIVHSDLKPANFVLVQGRLKLIDFGIANAIQDDTVHVHREQQVGTISYMSPEAIADYNQGMSNPGGARLPKLYKLGASSDVWSLGCILYQLTYGRTPFAHLANMYSKMQAIPNPKFQIEYPSLGIGGVPVPRALIETMKACLERDKERRVTIRELLSEEDRFLNPDREREGMAEISEDTLASVLENASEYTMKNGRPSSDQIKMWANDVYNKLKKRMFDRRGR